MVLRREPRDFYIDSKGDGQQSRVTKAVAVIDIDWKALLNEDQLLLGPLVGACQTLLPPPPAEPQVVEARVLEEDMGEETQVGEERL